MHQGQAAVPQAPHPRQGIRIWGGIRLLKEIRFVLVAINNNYIVQNKLIVGTILSGI